MKLIKKMMRSDQSGNVVGIIVIGVLVVLVWLVFTFIMDLIGDNHKEKQAKDKAYFDSKTPKPRKNFTAKDRQTVVKY